MSAAATSRAGLTGPAADLLEHLDALPLVDHHVHGAFTAAPSRQRVTGADVAASLATRLQSMKMHIPASPDAAALASKALGRVAANIPFSFTTRGRSYLSEESDRSRSGSRTRAADGAHVVSEQASRVLQKGIGWLLGADDE